MGRRGPIRSCRSGRRRRPRRSRSTACVDEGRDRPAGDRAEQRLHAVRRAGDQTSSTALQALTDAVLYLVAYPFECSEQLASRILAVAALRDVLTAFQAEGLPPPEEIEAAVARDIERLQAMQNDDGGFPIWRAGDESWPYHSIHAAHALQRAKHEGLRRAAGDAGPGAELPAQHRAKYPSWYDTSVRHTLTAYALYVRNLMGDADAARARKLIADKRAGEAAARGGRLAAAGAERRSWLDGPGGADPPLPATTG